MTDKPNLSTIPESAYLVQEMESKRIEREQLANSAYRAPLYGEQMMPGVEDEGSWLQRKARKK